MVKIQSKNYTVVKSGIWLYENAKKTAKKINEDGYHYRIQKKYYKAKSGNKVIRYRVLKGPKK